jgi:DNA repair protein SbcD/Mre11
MRFLHLADVHLDTLFVARDERLRRRLREASHQALRAAFAVARRERVDAVLMAGDLFDGTRLSLSTERFLVDALAELAGSGIPFLYATGNHDPADSGGRGITRLRWPDGVERFEVAEPRTVEVRRNGELVGTVTAAGHEGPREARDLSRAFRPPAAAGVPAVAMLHTQVGGARSEGDHLRYAPSERPLLEGAGFDYWALGHIHLRQELATQPGIHYPGNLQGRSPRETGAKGGLLVELTGPGALPEVTFVELAPVRWEEIRVAELAEAESLEPLLQTVEAGWREARRTDPGRPGTEWMLRVRLEGASPLHQQLRDRHEAEALGVELAARLGALEVEVRTEGLRPALDTSVAIERQDAAGEALRLVRRLAEPGGPSPSEALGVAPPDLAGFEGHEAAELDAYLRDLLEGADAELLERFMEGADPTP